MLLLRFSMSLEYDLIAKVKQTLFAPAIIKYGSVQSRDKVLDTKPPAGVHPTTQTVCQDMWFFRIRKFVTRMP